MWGVCELHGYSLVCSTLRFVFQKKIEQYCVLMQYIKFYFTLLLCKAIKISLPEGRMYVVKEGKTLKNLWLPQMPQ